MSPTPSRTSCWKATRATISPSSRSAARSATSRACRSWRASARSASKLPRGQCIYLHLTLLPYIPSAGELKTKPTQHSVAELRSIGIQPDILICRTDREIPREERRKLSLFCNVRETAVIEARDVASIYDVPLSYHAEGFDIEVLHAFGITEFPEPDMSGWRRIAERIHNPEGEVTIAVVGKYTELKDAYKSLIEALTHGGFANNVRVKLDWIEAEIFENEDPAPFLEHVHGILVPGGFGQRGAEGKIRAAKFARERKVPYFGICFGMQMACIEAARSLAGITEANSTEFGETSEPVVGMMTEWDARQRAGNPPCRRGSRRHDAARRLRVASHRRHPHRADVWHDDHFGAPSPPLRGQHGLSRPAGSGGADLLRGVSGRAPARDRRVCRPSLVHRGAIPPGTEVAAVRAAPAICRLHRGGA